MSLKASLLGKQRTKQWVFFFSSRKAIRWVDPERPRGNRENGRKWKMEEKGLVKSVKKVKTWEGEKIIFEKYGWQN